MAEQEKEKEQEKERIAAMKLTPEQAEQKTIAELYQIAKALEIAGYYKLRKQELIFEIKKVLTKQNQQMTAEGVLERMPDGYGFLRPTGYVPSNGDIYISPSQIRKFDLRTGDLISGLVRHPNEGERYFAMMRVDKVNGKNPFFAAKRLHFQGMTAVYPYQPILLSFGENQTFSSRMIDLLAPLGKGQRGLILAPPKCGKTMLLKNIANSIAANYPEIYLMILLIDERPEEVTDIENSVQAEVISSTFDELPENHVKVADMVLERAKRLVESGEDVVILMDSLTRLARANNLVIPPSGRTLSGGLDPMALHKPKRFFGAARKVAEGGSLTILATALIETGSRMDEVIFEEFKGTGNMELVLDRGLAERRIFPALDIKKSGTRRDDLLLGEKELEQAWFFRKKTANLNNIEVAELLSDMMEHTANNGELKEKYPVFFDVNSEKGQTPEKPEKPVKPRKTVKKKN